MDDDLKELLNNASTEVGVPLSEAQIVDFSIYMKELKKWNRRINLTSLKKDTDIVIKHFVDSLAAVTCIPMGSFCMDIGSGGGFPGLPIKIARPDLRFLLVEATGKKIAFLNHMIQELKLKNIRSLQQRAESSGFVDIMGGQLGTVIARAFSDMERLLEIGAPYLKKGGLLIAMRGKIKEKPPLPGKDELKTLRLKYEKSNSFELPHLGGERNIIVYKKR